jgi:fibronectin-binding autotransporter adhesin
MKCRNSIPRRLAGTGRALALAVFAFLAPAGQATNIWVGNTDANWSTNDNWSLGFLSPGDTPVFGSAGTGGTTLNNDTPAGTSYAGITFNDSAGHFTIAGNNVTCGGNITVGTNSFQTLGFDLALDANRVISVGTGGALTLGGVISGESGLTKSGVGIVFLTGMNSYSGATTVNGGILVAPALDIGGSPSSIGQSGSEAANLTLTSGGIFRYTGPAVSTDRGFTLAGNATLDAFGSGALNLTNPATPGYGGANAARTLTLTGMNPGDNTLAALLANNGTGAVAVTKTGSGTWILAGANTYTGVTTITGVIPTNGNTLIGAGTLVATTLADGGSPSSIGQAGNAANTLLLGTGTTLKYIGPGHSTNRNFTINGDGNNNIGATLDASGTGPVNFTNPATPAYGTIDRTRTLILSGSSTDSNTISALLANNGTAAVSLIKAGIGTWILNGAAANTYSGGTTVRGGTLIADFANLDTPTDLINSASALSFGGGTLAVMGKDGSASSQTFAGNPTFSLGGAGSGIAVTGGSGDTANLVLADTWTRNVGSTVNVTLGTGGTVTSSPAMANGLVVGSANIAFATAGGSDWAKVSGGTLAAFTSEDYTTPPFDGSTDSATGNYSITDSATVSAAESVNTLRIDTTGWGQSMGISDTFTLNAGGLLFVGGHDYSITGGTLRGSGGTQKDLVIHQFGAGTLTIDSLIANNGTATALTKSGPGHLALTNANTFTGATTVGGGTLVLKNQLALQSSTLTPNGGSVVFDSMVGENAFTLGQLASTSNGPGYDIALQNDAAAPISLTLGGNNTNTVLVGSLSGPGSLVKAGNGTLTLSGANSYTGTTTVSAGTLICGVAQLDSFLGTRPGGPEVTVQAGATLQLNRNNITGALTLNGGTLQHGNGFGATWSGSVVLDATSTFNITGNLNLAAVVSGSGGLTKIGGAILTLTRVNAYTGPTTVTAGVLKCDNMDSLGSGALSVSGTGKVNLNYTGTKAIASLTLGGVTKPAGTYGSLTSDAFFKDAFFEGPGKLAVGDPAALALITSFGANIPGSTAVIGPVVDNAATIAWIVPPATNLAALAPEFVLSPGATCSNQTSGLIPIPDFGAGSVTYSIVSQDSSTTNVYTVTATPLVPESTVIWNLAIGGKWNLTTFNWSGQVSGQPTLYSDGANVIFNKITGGTIEIDPDMSPLSTTVSAASGTFVFVGGPIATGSLTKSGGGSLQILGVSHIPPTGAPPALPHTYPGGTVIDGGSLILGGIVNTLTPAVNNPLGTGAVTLNAGTIEFNNNTVSNALIVNGGTLSNGNGWPSNWSGPVTLNSTATLSATYGFTISGDVTGSGGFIKNGPETVALSGTNSYTGPTSVTAGTMRIDSTNALSGGSALQISGTGKVNLNYSGSKVVASLSLGGVEQTLPGTYGSAASGAQFPNDTYFAGTGTVRIGSDYDIWLGGFTFAPGADTTPTGDPDGDGMANQEEYAFGLNPTLGSSVNPIVQPLDPATGIFQYTRRATPAAAKLTYTVLTSTDLAAWATGGATETGFTTAGMVETVTVHVTTPPVDGKLFVRVEAEPTP